MLVENVTLGSDVEFFVASPHGEIVTAEGLVRGTKSNPFRFKEDSTFFATQLDNVLAEGNIPPCKTAEEFNAHLVYLRDYIDKSLPMGMFTVGLASVRLDPKYLVSPTARTFGCDPSFDVWAKGAIIKLNMDPKDNLRTAGFHVHVGYKDPSEEKNMAIVKMLDMFLALHVPFTEPSNERQHSGYGRLGNFRHQPHGVEYRVLSSWWADNEARRNWVARSTLQAIDTLNSYKDLSKVVSALDEYYQILYRAYMYRDADARTTICGKFGSMSFTAKPKTKTTQNFVQWGRLGIQAAAQANVPANFDMNLQQIRGNAAERAGIWVDEARPENLRPFEPVDIDDAIEVLRDEAEYEDDDGDDE